LYGLLAATFLVAGMSVLLFGTGLLPTPMRDVIAGLAGDNLHTLHIMQEFASLLVFVGLITLWFIWHYEQSVAFHWAMTAFWGLVALIHWVDVRGPFQSVVGPAINTIPFVLFLAVGLLRHREKGRAASR
jgi:hypothetical protein